MLIKGLLAIMFLAQPVYETVDHVAVENIRLISDEISDKSYNSSASRSPIAHTIFHPNFGR